MYEEARPLPVVYCPNCGAEMIPQGQALADPFWFCPNCGMMWGDRD